MANLVVLVPKCMFYIPSGHFNGFTFSKGQSYIEMETRPKMLEAPENTVVGVEHIWLYFLSLSLSLSLSKIK